jgi:bifunctional non-homologous end joining protein LigD
MLRLARFIEPCLPTISRTVPTGAGWAYEIKHDGFCFISRRDGERVRVFSRRGHDWTDRVPRIVDALAALHVTSITIDGEGVVCGPDGVADFDRLRAAAGRKGSRDAFLYAFDLLELDGHDLRREPWEARRDALASLARNAGHDSNLHQGIRLSEHLDGADGDIVFRHACKLGLEGVVAKRRDRPYKSGRSPDWIKVKNPDAPAAMRIMECRRMSSSAPRNRLPSSCVLRLYK